MDLEAIEVPILSECGLFAFHNSIAVSLDTARVVTMNHLKNHLRSRFTTEYNIVLNFHGSLERFLKGPGRDYVRSEITRPWPQWNYELMTLDKYRMDKRHDHNCFSDLDLYEDMPSTTLFVFYDKEDKRRFEAERAAINKQERNTMFSAFTLPTPPTPTDPISDEIQEFYNNVKPSEDFFNKTKQLSQRIQRLVDKVWPDMGYEVTNFGSTANKLCFKDADVDLCIVVPKMQYEQELKIHRNKLSRQPKSVYNMYFLANRLKEIGMTHVEAIGNASVPICKFIDPQTGLRCDINANNVLGIENTQLIRIYADLDTRIRPFITAIKYFVKQKDINSPVGGTLSSYAYVLMALHFLIAGLEKPVIPSLQTLDANCKAHNNCRSQSKQTQLIWFNHKLLYCDTRYHDCVEVRNVATRKYHVVSNCFRNDLTFWKSYNKDTVSDLLYQFFEYFSLPDNHVVSIYNNRGDLVDYSPSYWNDYIIVQDPFIHSKNIARTCTAVGADTIVKEFQRAARLLRSNTPFAAICDKQYNIPRPVDRESMDYRFNQQKQQKQQQRGQQHSQKNDEIVDEEYERDFNLLEHQGELNELTQDEALRQINEIRKDIEKMVKQQREEIEAQQQEAAAAKQAKEQEAARRAKEKEAAAKQAKEQEAARRAKEQEAERRAKEQEAAERRAKEQEAAERRAKEQEAERRKNEEMKQRVLEEANQRKKKQEEQEKREAAKQKQAMNNGSSSSKEQLQQEIKKEILSENGARPIVKLVEKFFEHQPSDYSTGAPKPCLDMHELFEDPTMNGVTIGDIMYLMSQLNFMREAISETLESVTQTPEQRDRLSHILTPFADPVYETIIPPKPLANGSSSSNSHTDANTVYNVPTIFTSRDTGEQQQETEYVSECLTVFPVVKDEDLNDGMLSDEEWEDDDSLDDDDDIVDIHCSVKDVPKEIDSYEIYTQLVWHGRVVEIVPTKQLTDTTSWRVHMQVATSILKEQFPTAIQLGISESDFYTVSKPIIM